MSLMCFHLQVVCKELGYPRATEVTYFGRGTGAVWLSYVSCTGLESSLDLCVHGGWGRTSFCGRAGVICEGKTLLFILCNLFELILEVI